MNASYVTNILTMRLSIFQFATPVVAAMSTSSTSFHQLYSFSAGLAIVLFLSLRKVMLATNKFETLFVTIMNS